VSWLVSWLLPPPDAERRALQSMQDRTPPGPPERNAFPALWLMLYDGPDDAQRRALTGDDAARLQRALADGSIGRIGDSVAEGKFSRVAPAKEWCGRGVDDCLAQVRAAPDQVAQAHAGHARLHQRLAALSGLGYYQTLFPEDVATPIPPAAALLDRVSLHALAHVRGDSGAAMQGICEDVATARMLMRDGDSMVMAMVGGAMVERNAALFAGILAELPATAPVPAACGQAFAAPRVEELDMCRAMRGEYGYLRAAVASTEASGRFGLFDEHKTLARGAGLYARSCSAAVHAQIGQDRPVQLAQAPSLWSLRCLTNPVGCALLDVAAPAYEIYPRRQQDAGAQLRLVATLLWLRAQPVPPGGVAEALQQLPAGLGSAQRPWQLSADGRQLQARRLAPPAEGRSAVIQAPLPVAWQRH